MSLYTGRQIRLQRVLICSAYPLLKATLSATFNPHAHPHSKAIGVCDQYPIMPTTVYFPTPLPLHGTSLSSITAMGSIITFIRAYAVHGQQKAAVWDVNGCFLVNRRSLCKRHTINWDYSCKWNAITVCVAIVMRWQDKKCKSFNCLSLDSAKRFLRRLHWLPSVQSKLSEDSVDRRLHSWLATMLLLQLRPIIKSGQIKLLYCTPYQ